jgi:RpiR family carbohydrate utilization transcriptional regulator
MSKAQKQQLPTPPAGVAKWMTELSPRRRELIRPVIENPREFVLLSVRAAAARLHTDPATMVRVVQRMGFDSYRAFQNYLHDLSIANATSLDGMEQTTKPDMPSYLDAMLKQDMRNLNAVRTSLDTKRLALLAKRIHSARRVLLLGGDLAENLVHYFEHHLTIIGLPVLVATTVGRSLHITRSIGNGDLVVAMSFRRGLRQTVDGMRRARANGAYCIGITGTHVSPIARMADEYLVAPVESNSFIDSYVAPMALANLILVACANYNREASLSFLREAADEQRSGYRWYEPD